MNLRQGKVGKPSLEQVVGTGDSELIDMQNAGRVWMCSDDPNVASRSISRDPGQQEPVSNDELRALHKPKHIGGVGNG